LHEAGSPQFRLDLWRQVFDSKTYKEFFYLHEEEVWHYVLPVTAETAINRACSKSYIAALSGDERMRVKADIGAILEEGQDKAWIDESCGIFEYPYQTRVVVANRRTT
jgi:hypothetical protein